MPLFCILNLLIWKASGSHYPDKVRMSLRVPAQSKDEAIFREGANKRSSVEFFSFLP